MQKSKFPQDKSPDIIKDTKGMQILVGKTHNSYLIKESGNCDRKTETLVSLKKKLFQVKYQNMMRYLQM